MPIETDNSNHDFAWRFTPSEPNQEQVFFPLRLHKTPDYGWTVSFLNDEQQPEFSLPADMFYEVFEYIESYMRPANSPVMRNSNSKPLSKIGMPQIGRAGPAPSGRPSSRTVRTEKIASTDPRQSNNAPKKIVAEGREFTAEVIDANDEFSAEEGVFLPSGHDISDIGEEDLPAFQAFTVPEKPSRVAKIMTAAEDIDTEEVLAARRAAAQNPNKKGGIKKRHADNEE